MFHTELKTRVTWYVWLVVNAVFLQLYACLLLFFISNAIETQLISTGAFEVSFNGQCVFWSYSCAFNFVNRLVLWPIFFIYLSWAYMSWAHKLTNEWLTSASSCPCKTINVIEIASFHPTVILLLCQTSRSCFSLAAFRLILALLHGYLKQWGLSVADGGHSSGALKFRVSRCWSGIELHLHYSAVILKKIIISDVFSS